MKISVEEAKSYITELIKREREKYRKDVGYEPDPVIEGIGSLAFPEKRSDVCVITHHEGLDEFEEPNTEVFLLQKHESGISHKEVHISHSYNTIALVDNVDVNGKNITIKIRYPIPILYTDQFEDVSVELS